jgi:hypothetical protein
LRSDTAMLLAIGVKPDEFEKWAKPCPSTYSFASAVLGVPPNVIHCEIKGEHKRHAAIYHGLSYEWEDGQNK